MQLNTSIAYQEYEIGVPLTGVLPDSIVGLFKRNYHQYHYDDILSDDSTFRITATENGLIVGFAIVRVVKPFGLLYALLVDKDVRGWGIGVELDERRISYCQRQGIIAYSSCNTNISSSSSLKMKSPVWKPLNLKHGYRFNVDEPNKYTSAISFVSTDKPDLLTFIASPLLLIDERRQRASIISKDVSTAINVLFPKIEQEKREAFYIRCLVKEKNSETPENWLFTGVDYFFDNIIAYGPYYQYQYLNSAYEHTRTDPALVEVLKKL